MRKGFGEIMTLEESTKNLSAIKNPLDSVLKGGGT